jgi:hypothetical protein
MAFPNRTNICNALLIHLYSNQSHATRPRDAYDAVANLVGLSPSDRSVSRKELYGDNRPEPAWHSMVQYARRELVKKGLIARQEVGVWSLTDEGVKAAERLEKAGSLTGFSSSSR